MAETEDKTETVSSTSDDDHGLHQLRNFLRAVAQEPGADVPVNTSYSAIPAGRTAMIPAITKVAYTEIDVIGLIKKAREKNKVIRVEGSGHSYCKAIACDKEWVLRLQGELRWFEVISENDTTKTVKVGGGCYIGVNSLDDTSTKENSLMYHLNQNNCALPIVGGVTHQSIAGFMSTGSAGGSLQHGFEDVIREIHFINGLGERMVAIKGSDLFNAVGVSLGLFGVITYVVLEVPSPSFNVAGHEVRKKFDVCEPENMKVEDILESNEYAHLLWFPQKNAQFVIEWTAHKSDETKIDPYVNILSDKHTARQAAALLTLSQWFLRHFRLNITYEVIGLLLKLITRDTDTTFNDIWSNVLPSEDKVPVETTIQTQFTEMWFPIDKTQEVISILHLLFKDPIVAGNYATEIYGAKKSAFWLSPSYDRDVVRIDPFWFVFQEGDPKTFFSNFWEVLLSVEGIRFHWGKFLPEPGKCYGGTKFDIEFLEKSYPRLGDWLGEREKMDPHQVFVTKYWRDIFNIKSNSDTKILNNFVSLPHS